MIFLRPMRAMALIFFGRSAPLLTPNEEEKRLNKEKKAAERAEIRARAKAYQQAQTGKGGTNRMAEL